jgi:DNA-binding transcriptional LysR family regulator
MIKIEFDERDLRSLRVFCGVVQAGGFASAERTLLMSKASISRHVRAVEERLGVTLCERGPSGFRLTVEGEVAARLAFDAIRSL